MRQCHLGSPTPPTAAAAMQWGSCRAACGLRLELSGPTKRPGSLTATGWSEPAHLGYKLRQGTQAIGAAFGRARGLQTACRRDSAPLVLCPLSGSRSVLGGCSARQVGNDPPTAERAAPVAAEPRMGPGLPKLQVGTAGWRWLGL